MLNTLFSLGAVALLISFFSSFLPLLIVLPFLALAPSFLEAAILPDVFALHSFILVGITLLFLSNWNRRAWAISFLFFFALAHHHTIVLLFPILIFLAREKKWKDLILGSGMGLTTAALAYASIYFLHRESSFSWGELNSFSAFFGHFLRSDYGTFSLSSAGQAPFGAAFLQFLSSSFLPFSPVLLFTLWSALRRKGLEEKELAIFLCFILSLFFLFLLNIAPKGTGSEILLRFHLMPIVLGSVLALQALNKMNFQGKEKWIMSLFSVLFAFSALGRVFYYPELRKDVFLDFYAKTYLEEAQANAPAVIFAEGDAAYFALRYRQILFAEGKGVAVVADSLLFHPWYLKKIQMQVPFILPDKEKIWDSKVLTFESIFRENSFRFFSTRPRVEKARTIFFPLGRLLEKGEGLDFTGTPIQEIPSLSPPQFEAKNFLRSHFSHYYLAKGAQAYARGALQDALEAWNSTLKIVPNAYPALANICLVSKDKDPRCKADVLKTMRENFVELTTK